MRAATIARFVPAERFEPAHAALRRTVFSGRGCFRFALGGRAFQLRFVDEPPMQYAEVALQWRLGKERAWLGLESLDVFRDMQAPDWVSSLGMLPLALSKALLLEDAGDSMRAVARACAEPVAALDLRRSHCFARSHALQALRLCSDATGVCARAVLCAHTPGLWRQLEAGIRRSAPPALAPRTRLEAAITLAPVALDVREYAQLRTGDTLVFADSGCLGAVAAWLSTGTREPLVGVHLCGRQGRIVAHSTKEAAMEMKDALPECMHNGSPAQRATVQITAVLGRVDLPWHALDAVEAGYVFELPCEPERSSVQLYAGRRLAGEGRLVSVGERLGVCVTRWHEEGDHDGTT
jgi:type III secretion system YscQ/HrcQ family protein